MEKYWRNNKKIVSFCLILIIGLLGIFAFGNKSEAAVESIRIPVIGHVIGAVLELIKMILSKLLYLSANLADAILGITQFTKASIVTIGWTITRDLTNMFFVLILIVIALATILKVDTYGMKSLLPKLIIAALLINFSLVIAGFIIDFSQVLTNFFIESAAADENVSVIIMEGLQVHTLFEHDNTIWENIKDAAAGPSFAQITESVFAIIILLASAFAFVAFAFFLLIRIVILWLLLIVSPIVWLLMVIPQGQGLWNKWWTTFIKWVFFAPIYSFFLYIVLTAIKSKVISTEVTNGITLADGAVFSSIFASNPQIILQYIFIIMMLLGGLIFAQQAGVYGASGAISLAKTVGKKTGKFGWWGTRAGAGAIGQIPGLKDRTTKIKNRVMTGLEKMPIIGRTLGGPGKYAGDRAKKIEEERKELSSRTAGDLETMSNKVTFTEKDRIRKAASIAESAKKGGFKDTGAKAKGKLDFLKRMHGDTGEVLKYRPDLASLVEIKNSAGKTITDPRESIRKVVSGIKAKDTENLQTKHVKGDVLSAIKHHLTDVKGTWKKDHLAKMAELNPSLFAEIKKEIIDKNKGNFRPDIETFIDSSAGKAIFGDVKPASTPAPPSSTA